MKLTGFIALLAVLFAFPLYTDAQTGPQMTFESTTVDYGEIERGSERIRTVSFTNTGDEPLVITNARGSCGCTVPDYPRDPIQPGESAEFSVNYDTNRMGNINRTIRITTNESGDPHVLMVRGRVVEKKEEESLPKKNSNIFDN
ncbi:MAG: DUF1573 domain-containing protein [Saprospirales bacterium]|nr:MAG: DUF1573 domain-containing protein [Saprospirales bacterium]